jgi:dCTP deaminase
VILSNVELQQAIDAGDVVIQPAPTPIDFRDPECPYDTTAVNLRLSEHLSVVPQDPPGFAIDLRGGKASKLLAKIYEPCLIPKQGFCLDPGAFALGNSVETIALPIRPGRSCYAARVEGKSSFARSGLVVHLTAPTIHAGFDGRITFEFKNLGPYPILLFAGMYIAQLIVEPVQGIPNLRLSQFQGQTLPAGPSQ